MSALIRSFCLAILGGCASETGSGSTSTSSVIIGGCKDDGTGYLDWHSSTIAPNIVMGPQGGQHVYVSVRATSDFYVKNARITVDGLDLDTGDIVKPGAFEFTRSFTPEGSGLGVVGLTSFVKEPCKIKGHRVRMHVHVEDLVGLTGDDEAIITPSWNGFCAN